MLDLDKLGFRKKDFEDYVRKYSSKHNISQKEAETHKLVQEVYKYYLNEK